MSIPPGCRFTLTPDSLDPTGPAGGDLSGDYPDPVVAQSSADPFVVTKYISISPGAEPPNGNGFYIGAGSGSHIISYGAANAALSFRPTGGSSSTNAILFSDTGVITPSGAGGYSSAELSAPTTVTPTSGVAFIPSAAIDAEIFFVVETADTITITCGPTTGAEYTLIPNVLMPVGATFTKRIRAGWSVIITGTIADLAPVTVQTL